MNHSSLKTHFALQRGKFTWIVHLYMLRRMNHIITMLMILFQGYRTIHFWPPSDRIGIVNHPSFGGSKLSIHHDTMNMSWEDFPPQYQWAVNILAETLWLYTLKTKLNLIITWLVYLFLPRTRGFEVRTWKAQKWAVRMVLLELSASAAERTTKQQEENVPSRGLTYPTWGKGKSFFGDS